MSKARLAIFVSGAGTNAMNIINYFKDNNEIEIGLILSNNPLSPIIDWCEERSLEICVASNTEVANPEFLIQQCQSHSIDYIILAGYLRLIPINFIKEYAGRIINIHPALLPKYGGKGMYGDNVHSAVLNNGESESGISIHFVDEEFDCGPLIAQMSCKIDPNETVSSLKAKIQELEHAHFPKVIEETIKRNHLR